MKNRSDRSLCRVWKLEPLRAGFIIADVSVAADESSKPCLRLPPRIKRNSEEFLAAKKIAEEHNIEAVGYAYFAADYSAAEEPVFDPETLICHYASQSYFTQRF